MPPPCLPPPPAARCLRTFMRPASTPACTALPVHYTQLPMIERVCASAELSTCGSPEWLPPMPPMQAASFLAHASPRACAGGMSRLTGHLAAASALAAGPRCSWQNEDTFKGMSQEQIVEEVSCRCSRLPAPVPAALSGGCWGAQVPAPLGCRQLRALKPLYCRVWVGFGLNAWPSARGAYAPPPPPHPTLHPPPPPPPPTHTHTPLPLQVCLMYCQRHRSSGWLDTMARAGGGPASLAHPFAEPF